MNKTLKTTGLIAAMLLTNNGMAQEQTKLDLRIPDRNYQTQITNPLKKKVVRNFFGREIIKSQEKSKDTKCASPYTFQGAGYRINIGVSDCSKDFKQFKLRF